MVMVQMENDTTELKMISVTEEKNYVWLISIYINEQGLLLIRDGTNIDTISCDDT